MARLPFLTIVLVAVPPALALPTVTYAAGVAFLDQKTVQVPRGAKRVVVFNGSSQTRQLSVRVLGSRKGELAIRPTETEVGPGATTTFELTIKRLPKKPADRTLLATSSDGTIARLGLRLGAADPPLPKLPKKVDFGVVETGSAERVEISGLRPEPKPVGTLYGDNRKPVAVTSGDGALVVAGPPAPGKYTGQIDVAPTRDGGESELTVKARESWFPALLVLILGIMVGLLVEFWLTRWRPAGLLDRRLKRLLDRVERRQIRVNRVLKKRYESAYPSAVGRPGRDADPVWMVPPAYVRTPPDVWVSYFARAGRDLLRALRDATTDPERELFGPDGDEFKALLANEGVHNDFVGDLLEVTRVTNFVFAELHDDPHVPIRARVAELCNGNAIIGDATMLAARRDEAKALRVAVEHFVDFYNRLEFARALADDADKKSLASDIGRHHEALTHTFRGADDQVEAWSDAVPALEQKVYVDEAAQAPDGQANPAADAMRSWAREPELLEPVEAEHVAGESQVKEESATRGDRRTRRSPGEGARKAPPWSAPWGLRDGFGRFEKLIGAVSFLIIAATGMSALYVPNETFGSSGDYLSVAIWGSTATAALALARRLLPGALTTLQQGI